MSHQAKPSLRPTERQRRIQLDTLTSERAEAPGAFSAIASPTQQLSPAALDPARLLSMQHAVGNQAVQRMLARRRRSDRTPRPAPDQLDRSPDRAERSTDSPQSRNQHNQGALEQPAAHAAPLLPPKTGLHTLDVPAQRTALYQHVPGVTRLYRSLIQRVDTATSFIIAILTLIVGAIIARLLRGQPGPAAQPQLHPPPPAALQAPRPKNARQAAGIVREGDQDEGEAVKSAVVDKLKEKKEVVDEVKQEAKKTGSPQQAADALQQRPNIQAAVLPVVQQQAAAAPNTLVMENLSHKAGLEETRDPETGSTKYKRSHSSTIIHDPVNFQVGGNQPVKYNLDAWVDHKGEPPAFLASLKTFGTGETLIKLLRSWDCSKTLLHQVLQEYLFPPTRTDIHKKYFNPGVDKPGRNEIPLDPSVDLANPQVLGLVMHLISLGSLIEWREAAILAMSKESIVFAGMHEPHTINWSRILQATRGLMRQRLLEKAGLPTSPGGCPETDTLIREVLQTECAQLIQSGCLTFDFQDYQFKTKDTKALKGALNHIRFILYLEWRSIAELMQALGVWKR